MMICGDIILIQFPFSDLSDRKLRPAIVVTETKDAYNDIVICAISSVIPMKLSDREILIKSSTVNELRADSIIKVDRLATLKKTDVRARLGKLNRKELSFFRSEFCKLLD